MDLTLNNIESRIYTIRNIPVSWKVIWQNCIKLKPNTSKGQ
jgi:hypothetical protein